MSETEFVLVKKEFEDALANLIKKKADELKVEKITFNHMHNFVLGGDDRDFSRRFIKTYFSEDSRVGYEKKLSTVNSIVESMQSSELNICMRFHSVLFAETLKTNFLALDYTLGGKIAAYISENSESKNLLTINQLIKDYSERIVG